jgi:hypothetical protein
VGQHLPRGRIARAPGGQMEVVAELARALEHGGVRAQGDAADGPVGQAAAEALEGRPRAFRPDLHQRAFEARLVEAPPGGRGHREELVVQTVRVAGVEVLPEGRSAEDRHSGPHVTRPPSPAA